MPIRSTTKRRTVDPAILADVVQRVVRAAQPESIIMFGSAAHSELGPNSDLDLLVVKRGSFDRLKVSEAIYRNLHGAGAAVDAVVVTPEEVERFRDAPSMVICPAIREGKVVYGAQTPAAG